VLRLNNIVGVINREHHVQLPSEQHFHAWMIGADGVNNQQMIDEQNMYACFCALVTVIPGRHGSLSST
jgi:hypothetical protein